MLSIVYVSQAIATQIPFELRCLVWCMH